MQIARKGTKVILSMYLDIETYNFIENIAKKDERSLSWVACNIIKSYKDACEEKKEKK